MKKRRTTRTPTRGESHHSGVFELYSGLARNWTYLVLVALRLLGIFSPGYIHPDEFFQSLEVTSSDLLNLDYTHRPWEFSDVQFPCRSITPPYLMTALPLLLAGWFSSVLGYNGISSFALFIMPRLWLFVLSFILDISVCIIANAMFSNSKRLRESVEAGVLSIASSWTIALFHLRPFSNTLESLLLASCLAITSHLATTTNVDRLPMMKTLLLGALTALGIFTRFTFAFFFAPIGLFLLWLFHSPLSRLIAFAAVFVSVFLTTSGILVLIDSWYFGSGRIQQLVLTPGNSLRYNMQTQNLALHGLHPKYTHLVANMPIMFGPLAVWFLWCTLREALDTLYLSRRVTKPPRALLQQARLKTTACFLKWVLRGCVISGVGVLSMAPHQEPRFLLPLAVPMTMLASQKLFSKAGNKRLLAAWLAFNAAMAMFFGVFHQAGVLRSIVYISEHLLKSADEGEGDIHVAYFHTYMPPLYLLGVRRELHGMAGGWCRANFTDLKSEDISKVQMWLRDQPEGRRSYIVAPASVRLDQSVDVVEKIRFCPHLTTEDWPSHLNDLALVLYKRREMHT